ncbi:P-loop containing nucleoside triphosphate hydrolase protein [Apiosordaria backusii]|uniref:P-loop containing nucleoside triphosphate hydrolase protein n=1 Tax=Apiosordaria backusii TaxID=314023 RepID=A0AA40ETL2_9PEZI|nr:P-loop containing nucleoside triphosphate hydrolase protein [Apiosordaria backusii]
MVASFVWTPEEAKYLKAVLRWQDAPSSDDDNNTKPRPPRRKPPPPPPENEQFAHHRKQPQQQSQEKDEPPAGEFRVLILGAKSTGKSSLLTRFSQNTFPPSPSPPTTTGAGTGESHPTICRHPIHLNSSDRRRGKYLIDALEFPSNHLSSNPLLEQALAITEAAVVVYDITSPDSFQLAKGLVQFISEHFNPLTPSPNHNHNNNNRRSIYPVILAANKSDSTERRVTMEEGHQAVERLPGVKFMEVSAKTGRGVKEVFEGVGGRC